MMNNISYNQVSYKTFDVVGHNVLLEKMKNDDCRFVDGIYLPKSEKNKNEKMGVGKVLEIGAEVDKDLGLNVGDFVLYDYYAANGDWVDNVIVKDESLLCILSNAEANDFLNDELKF